MCSWLVAGCGMLFNQLEKAISHQLHITQKASVESNTTTGLHASFSAVTYVVHVILGLLCYSLCLSHYAVAC